MAKRKTTTAAKSRQKAAQTRRKNQESKTAKKQLWAVVLFALGLLFLFLALIPGQNVWLWLHNVLFGIFGWCAYLIAPILIYIAVVAALDKPIGSVQHKLWQTVLLVILICGATQAFANPEMEWPSVGSGLAQLFDDGVHLKGGGVMSVLVSVPLVKLLGVVPARVTILLLIFVLFMLITGATLLDLARTASKPVKKIEEAYIHKVESNQLKKKNLPIDIPVEDEPMPEHPVKSPKGSQSGAQPLLKAKDKLLSAAGSFIPPLTPSMPDDLQPQQPEPEAGTAQPEPESELHRDPAPEMDISSDGQITPRLKWKDGTGADKLQIEELVNKVVDQQASPEPGTQDKGPAPVTTAPPVSASTDPAAEEPYQFPTLDLLNEAAASTGGDISEELKANAQRLVDTLKSFGVQTRIVDISRGPTVTRYELQPSAGVKISKITSLADDIALNLAAAGVRIEAPIPNKPAVGIEVPNKTTSIVGIREIIDSKEFVQAKSRLTIALGKDISGNIAVADVGKMPHMLIAGATGSGKSVCINSIIISLLFKSSPEEVKFLMVDPKVVELGVYNGIPHLLVPVVTDPRKAAGALNWAVAEMLKRYKLFADNSVRDLHGYNELAKTKDELQPLPQIVIIIDELADLMMAAPNEVEDAICRLAQMARAAGMHLVIATQRPSVDVITGVIKANIPSRIAFAVSSQVDSRTILDSGGAEKLLGRGDMLYYPVGAAKPLRVQGCFVSDHEVENVVSYIKAEYNSTYDEHIIEEIDKQAVKEKSAGDDGGDDGDPMLEAAIEAVVEAGQASTSLLQRRLKLGYARAARIVDEMEQKGIVGPYEGSKPRQVLISRQQWMERKLNQEE